MLESDWFSNNPYLLLNLAGAEPNCPIWPVRLLAAFNRTVKQPMKIKHWMLLANKMLANQNQGELLKWTSCPGSGSGFYFLFWIICILC